MIIKINDDFNHVFLFNTKHIISGKTESLVSPLTKKLRYLLTIKTIDGQSEILEFENEESLNRAIDSLKFY